MCMGSINDKLCKRLEVLENTMCDQSQQLCRLESKFEVLENKMCDQL